MRIGFFGAIAILGAALSAPAQDNRCIDHDWLTGQCDGPAACVWDEPGDEPYVAGWCYRRQGLIVDAGVYVLAPRWGNNAAYAMNTYVFDGVTVSDQTLDNDFPTETPAAPFVSLAYLGQRGLGMRGRWWGFDSRSSALATNPAEWDFDLTNTLYSANPLGLGFSGSSAENLEQAAIFGNHLEMNVFDVEAVWDLHPGRGSLLLTAGVRYAAVDQQYNVFWLQSALDPLANNISGQLVSGHRFHGAGPTLSVEGRYPLGSSHVAMFAGPRGSVLFGPRRESASLNATITDYYGDLVEEDQIFRSAEHDRVLPVGEVEVGAAYSRLISHYRLNLEAAFVAQAWWNAGNPANNDTNPGSYIAASSDATMGLVGFRVTAGLSY